MISSHNILTMPISNGFCTSTWFVPPSTCSTCFERQVIPLGSGDMLPRIHSCPVPPRTCHMPGPVRSLVTTTSSSTCGRLIRAALRWTASPPSAELPQ